MCSRCEPDYYDIDLTKIALDLEQGYSSHFICEGCGCLGVFKDEKGLLYLVFRERQSRDVRFDKVVIEEL